MNKSNLRAIVVDNTAGIYLSVALTLSKSFSKMYYYSSNQSPFPRISMDMIGLGYDSIERLDDFWNNLDLFDVVIFPDIYYNDWGIYLRKIGKLVWGGCKSEDLETNRNLFRQELKNVNLPIANAKIITGLDNLSNYLNQTTNKWVKLSYYRGEMETFKHINRLQSEVFLSELRFAMGPLADYIEFVVEDNIDSIAETGYDGYLVNGKAPNSLMWGLELKDCGYIGKANNFNEMPKQIQYINKTFEPVLQRYNHTGFYSTEIRIGKDGKPYYTDLCARAGAPPSNVYMELISNWDQIIVNGAKNILIEPIFNAKYGVEIILKSNYCNKGFLPVNIDKKWRNNLKLKGSFIQEGKDYVVPFTQGGFDMVEFGSVVVIGNDLQKIIEEAIMIAENVDAYGVSFDGDALQNAMEELNNIETTFNTTF